MANAHLALGTAQLGMPYGIANQTGQPTDAEVFRILDFALQHEVFTWDTAPGYGTSETVLGRFIATNPQPSPVICTKLPSFTRTIAESRDKRLSEWVQCHIERSLETLSVGRIDYYLVHDEKDFATFGTELLDSLCEFQNKGLLKTIGISVYSPDIALEALDREQIGAIQIPINLFDQRFIKVLAAAIEKNTTVFARSVFLQGLFFLNPESVQEQMPDAVPYLRQLQQLAKSTGRSIKELALGYVRDTPGISQLVVGVESLSQMEANVHLMNCAPLSPTLRAEIAESFGDVPIHIVNPSLWPRRK